MDLFYLILLIPLLLFILLIILLIRQRKRKIDRLYEETLSIIDTNFDELLKNDIKSPH